MSARAPPSSAQRGKLGAGFSAVSRIWHTVQVELHGDYPIDHIKAFHEYAGRTSWWRALLVCLLTPVPGALLVLLGEIVPLEDPDTHDARSSPNVWLRFFLLTIVGSSCVLEQFRQHVPSLELARRSMIAIVVPSAIATTLVAFLLADQIAYPMPFISNIAMGPWLFILLGLLFFTIRQQFHDKPQLIVELKRHQFVCAYQIALAVVYPLYNTVFVRLSAWEQTAFVFLLPCIKVAAKTGISRWLATTDEARSEGVIFNVEVFHALFVSFSMQGSSGVHTIIALMIIDAVHMWLSFQDIKALLLQLKPMFARQSTAQSTDIVALANAIAEVEPFHGNRSNQVLQRKESQSFRTVVKSMCCHLWSRKVQDAPAPSFDGSSFVASPVLNANQPRRGSAMQNSTLATGPPLHNITTVDLPPELRALTVNERGLLVRGTQKLLFVTEFVTLIEFTEVMIPCLFNMYLLIMYHFSNRRYYDFLAHIAPETLNSQVASIATYASLELASLLITGIILKRQLGLSVLHQIAFVLEERQASIQSKIVMWSILVLQYGVRQFGVDYTFQFAWLHNPSPGGQQPG